MLNFIKNFFKRNDSHADAYIQAVNDKLMQVKKYDELNSCPASRDFRETLKAKILEARHEKKYMKNFLPAFQSFFTVRRMAPALAFLVIVALVITTVRFWPDGSIGGFSKLIISPAYAQDNFSISATKSDSLGVESNTAFVIKSREAVDEATLRKNLQILPTTEFSFEKISDYEFKVTPKTALVTKKVYSVKIAASFIAATGAAVERNYSWAFQVKNEFKVLNTLPRDKTSNVPLDTGIEITFSHENFSDYEKAVKIMPAVIGKFEKHRRTVVFVPQKLEPGVIYTVTVDKNLKVEGSDNGLKENLSFSFETDASGLRRGESAWFNLSRDYTDFSTAQAPIFELWADNVGDSAAIEVYNYPSADAFIKARQVKEAVPAWADYARSAEQVDTVGLNKTATLTVKFDEYQNTKYLSLPEKFPAGFYVANIKVKDIARQAFFQVTDISAYATVTDTQTLIWVNDLAAKKALPSAKITVTDTGFNAETGDDGAAMFDTAKAFGLGQDGKTFYVKVTSGARVAVVPLGVYDSYDEANNDYWMYFYSDRQMYKPTDTVNFWGFVKLRDNKKIGADLKIVLSQSGYYDYDYQSVNVAEAKLKLDAAGGVSGQLKLDKVTPGYYSAQFVLGDRVIYTRALNVQTYAKPAYNLTMKIERHAVMAGEKIKAEVLAAYFDGTPVPGLELKYEGGKENGQIKTDTNGKAIIEIPTFSFTCEKDKLLDCDYPNPYNVYLSVRTVRSEEGDIYAEDSVGVYNSPVYTFLGFEQKNDQTGEVAGRVVNIDFNALNAGDALFSYGNVPGKPAAGKKVFGKIEVKVSKKKETGEYYDFINKIVRKNYDYWEETEKVISFDSVTDEKGEFKYELPVLPGRTYRARTAVADDAGKGDYASAYMFNRAEWEGSYDYYALRINNAKNESDPRFAIGENVAAVFEKNEKPMADGVGDFLFYKLHQGLLDYSVGKIAGYSFEFKKEHVPNVGLIGVWFDGKAYHRASYGWSSGGAKQVRYNYDLKDLKVKVETNKKKYAPGEAVALDVTVTDKNNASVEANVNLNLVDEAFYKLIGDFASPLAELYADVGGGERGTYASHPELVLRSSAEGGGCFLAGTRISMADGSTKEIQNVRAGDKILTYENERGERLVPGRVVKTFTHLVDNYLVINGDLRVTPEHRAFVNGGWQTIGEARVGDHLVTENGSPVKIESMRSVRARVLVYNFHVEKYQTYFANGIYVHNDKGGGRSDFRDTAFFAAVKTDIDGTASVKFKLPDNLTSWRITTQVISPDLFAGKSVTNIAVGLPVFVEATLAEEYVAADEPVVKLRSFGEKLLVGDKVKFGLEFNDKKQVADSEAFQSAYVALGQLSVGEQTVKATIKTSKGDDALIKSVKVVNSRLKDFTADYYALKDGLKIKNIADGRTTLVFTDGLRGSAYRELDSLSWNGGDRVDQKLARVIGAELLNQYFDEKVEVEEFDNSVYQLDGGAVVLLPYADGDLELSAKTAAAAADKFSRSSLTAYFYQFLTNGKSTAEEVGLALYGLAALDEPVLKEVQNYVAIPELKPLEKLYVALAAERLGDAELARTIYLDLMAKYAEKKEPYIRLAVSKNADEIAEITSLASVLAAKLNDANQIALWKYMAENPAEESLNYLDAIAFLQTYLPRKTAAESSFVLEYGGKKMAKKLVKDEAFSVLLTSEELAQVKFSAVSGDVSVVVKYEKDLAGILGEVDKNISLDRRYFVDGKETNNFKETDLVEVRLYPRFGKTALSGSYQLTDLLPSGLRIISSPYQWNLSYDCQFAHPYAVDGNRLKFRIYEGWGTYCGSKYLKYYARVVSTGQYAAEPATIQSFKSLQSKNYSGAGIIIIER